MPLDTFRLRVGAMIMIGWMSLAKASLALGTVLGIGLS